MNNKNKLIKKVLVSVIPFFVFLLPFFIFAAGEETTRISNPIKFYSVSELIDKVLDYVVIVGGVVATLAFIWAGFVYVSAQGKPEKLKTAKEIFINTCIGAAILLGAELISKIITGTISSLK